MHFQALNTKLVFTVLKLYQKFSSKAQTIRLLRHQYHKIVFS